MTLARAIAATAIAGGVATDYLAVSAHIRNETSGKRRVGKVEDLIKAIQGTATAKSLDDRSDQPATEIPGGYGVVAIVAGKHAGHIGYYDDDGDRGGGVVYIGRPFSSEYKIVRYKNMRPATQGEVKEYQRRIHSN